MTFTQAHVVRLAALPASSQVAVLRSIPHAQRIELIRIARGMVGGDGLGFFPAIGAFLFNAAKVVGAVATTAATGALTNVLGGSKAPTPQPTTSPNPASQRGSTPAWVIPALLVGGVVLLAARR